MGAVGSQETRSRRRRVRSPWQRVKKRLREKRYELALAAAVFLSCGGALLIFLLIRPA